MAFLVNTTALAGGWLYFQAARTALRQKDLQHAIWRADALAISAQQDLLDRHSLALQKLAADCIRAGDVLYVALIDSRGTILASAGQDDLAGPYAGLASTPVSLSHVDQIDDNRLTFARPIVLKRSVLRVINQNPATEPSRLAEGTLAGALRLVLDTTATTRTMRQVQQRMAVIAAALVVCTLPLGYLLVWRVIVQPARRLVAVTSELRRGNFTCRAAMPRNDELGELSYAFDMMADEISRSREALVQVNSRLENKVVHRTQEIEELHARLREEKAEREDFLHAVSEDLSIPLGRIAGTARILSNEWRSKLPQDVVQQIDVIADSAEAEVKQVSYLLDLSEIRASSEGREVVEVAAMLQQMAEEFAPELTRRRIELTIQPQMPTIYVEVNRLRQLFWNLIHNAIKYMNRSHSGKIEVGYSLSDGYHRFHVKDNGPGVDIDEQRTIFRPCRRGQVGMATGPGRGLGLAAVRAIVANYEGRAWVESQPGQGATFYVTFAESCTLPPAGL